MDGRYVVHLMLRFMSTLETCSLQHANYNIHTHTYHNTHHTGNVRTWTDTPCVPVLYNYTLNTHTFEVEGTYQIGLEVEDIAGNIGNNPNVYTYTYDITPPEITLTSVSQNTSDFYHRGNESWILVEMRLSEVCDEVNTELHFSTDDVSSYEKIGELRYDFSAHIPPDPHTFIQHTHLDTF